MNYLKYSSLFVLLLVSGCFHHPNPESHATTMLPDPPEVKAAPAVRAMDLDTSLRQSALGELLKDCNSTDPYMRSNAIEGLADSSPADAERPILTGLHDDKPNVRFAAAVAAGQLQIKSAHQLLLAMAEDDDKRVQSAVRFALHRLGDTRLSHDLENYARDIDPRVRGVTAQVLGMLNEPSALNVLRPMEVDPAPNVRIQVAEAMWRLHDEEGLKALVGYSISAFPDDQIIALVALAEPKDPSVMGHIHGALISDYVEVSLAAARGMGMLGSDEGWTVAVPRAKSKDPRQRSMAALAMGAIGRSDLQPILEPMLKDPDATVRISAATAILQLHMPQSAGG